MQRIVEDIKNEKYHNVYLLYGKQDYLRKQYRDKLKDALTGGETTMNYSYFEGNQATVPEIIDLAETLPFFAPRRVIVLEDTGWFKSSEDQLADYLKSVCESTIFVIVEKEVDKRCKTFKACDSVGLCVEFDDLDEATLKKWILGKLRQENKMISERALNVFLDMVGNDMENIQKELEKLVCYCLEKDSITPEDVESICTRRVSEQIFDMINAIAEKKQRVAMDLYYDLLALKVAPLKTLALISRQFNLLLQVKQLKNKGYNDKQIAANTGLNPRIVYKYVAQASRFKTDYLRQALEDCVKTDEAVKTGMMNDVMSVELLIVQYSS